MKFLTKILLFVFIAFLSRPTLVILFEGKSNALILYDLSEEENQKENKDLKEFKSDFTINNQIELISFKINYSNKIISENISKHDTISEEIFSPPPELV